MFRKNKKSETNVIELDPTNPQELIKKLEPRAKELCEQTAAACQALIEALDQQKQFLDEIKPAMGFRGIPGHWRIAEPIKRFTVLALDSENNSLQRVLKKFDSDWGGME